MAISGALPPWLAVVAAFAVVFSVTIYAQFLRRLWPHGGRVRSAEFGIPDLFVGSFLMVWLIATIAARGIGGGEARPVTVPGLVQGAVMFGVLVILLAAFLRWRGLWLTSQFGLAEVCWWKVPLLGFAFLLAALPATLAISAASQIGQNGPVERQPLVDFFIETVRTGDQRSMLTTLLMGAVVAPIAEEFLFRGYIYGVLKRYAWWPAALVLTSLFFAAIHLNAASFLPLFLLAIALTVAYEVTGSILVNMTMHALFNLTMFAGLWFQAQQQAAQP